MSERIGLRYPESIDKISVLPGEGNYRLTIGQFEAWETIEDPCNKLREKIEHYLTVIKYGSLFGQFPDLKGKTGQITLMTPEPLPKDIEEYFNKLVTALQSHGVMLNHWTTKPD